MADFASPGVIAVERDFSQILKMLGTATGGTVINSKWGAVGVENVTANEEELVKQAGKPTDKNFRDWFVARSFLDYTSSLRWVRVIDDETAINASVGGSPILIKSKSHIDVVRTAKSLTQEFVAKYPGDLGTSLSIEIADGATFKDWKYADLFDTAPNSSASLPTKTEPADDEMHIVVIDRLGLFSGTSDSVLETYAYVSKARDGKGVNGDSNYYINVINNRSEYLWTVAPLGDKHIEDNVGGKKSAIGKALSEDKQFAKLKQVYRGDLTGGADGDTPGKDEYIDAFDVLTSPDDTDIALLFAGGCGDDANHQEVSSYVLKTATNRGDMLAFVSPKYSDVVGVQRSLQHKNVLTTKEKLRPLGSFGVITTGYKLIYDRYNDVNRWIPGNGDDAGLCANAENNFDVWVSPAGFSRGHYKDCIALAFEPNKNERDILYKNNINPVATFPKDGTILYGDKTLQAKNSAFSWIGIRRLFIYLRKAIRDNAKYNLFEFNTAHTRQAFKDTIEPVLREIKGRNGIFDFYVRCDESNNTDQVIQAGEFVADIIIKPQYSIQGIRLSFTAVRREVSFDEVIV